VHLADAFRGSSLNESALLGLLRRLHDEVVQRLVGASMVLARVDELAAEDARRAGSAVADALTELRAALLDAAQCVDAQPAAVPTVDAGALTTVTRAVISEAYANSRKHALPTELSITVSAADGHVAVDLVNDGVLAESQPGGIGLQLARLEAERVGGVLDCGPAASDCWSVSLRLPG
jgi:signal transduction histidine kinase